MLLYNIGMWFYGGMVRIIALFNPKAKLWVSGRIELFEQLRYAIETDRNKSADGEHKIAWVHCASLGEFEQGRTLIEALRKERTEYKILLTFFSPSGYEIRRNYKGADYVFYLPLDTPRNVRRFMSIVRPELAFFIKYEFWLNYLRALRRQECRTFIISAIFRPNSVFFKFYGGLFRRALRSFETLFVQNDESKELLSSIGVENVIVSGDTRFDRVAQIASCARELPIVSEFSQGAKVFVAGSSWAPDEELILELIEDNPQIKFIIVPHEIEQARIDSLVSQITRQCLSYTRCTTESDLHSGQVLIIDTIGILSSVYQYADVGYIGGGFGAGIHNTLEAATFGLPIAFGPNYAKFKEARELIECGAAQSVANYKELSDWFTTLINDDQLYQSAHNKALRYIADNTGATRRIIDAVFLNSNSTLTI